MAKKKADSKPAGAKTQYVPLRVNNGDILSCKQHLKVTHNFHDTLEVIDLDTGKIFEIRGQELIDRHESADFFLTEEKKCRSDIAMLLIGAGHKAFTVEFVPEKNKGKDNIMARKLRGRLIKPEMIFGRSLVEDLDLPLGKNTRLVDHRTLLSLIIDRVKYVVSD